MPKQSIEQHTTLWQKFTARVEQLPGWVIPVFICLLTLIVALVFLWPSYLEFPMDDTYIHFVYAQNLAEHWKLFFSFPAEKGVATSSILWVILLAAGTKIGISSHLLAKVLGAASLAFVGLGVYQLTRPLWHPYQALGAALLVTLSGNMLWFSLSGMETVFFLALGMSALLLHRAGRWGWLGLTLGLLTLTRPDGLFLLGAIGVIELASQRRLRREFVLAAVICLAISVPWFAYLKWRTGDFLPTSASGKQLTTSVALDYTLERYGLPKGIGQFSGLLYPGMWAAYLLEFGMGGMALPDPKMIMVPIANGSGIGLSIWSLPAIALLIWLMVLAGKRFFAVGRWREWLGDPTRRAILLLFAWVVLHNLAYMIVLPMPGTASRYGAINYVILWIAIVAGFSHLARRPKILAAACVLVVAAANSAYWNSVYDANLEHMVNVRIAAAHYIRDEIPPDELCAAFDIGSVRYFSGRPLFEIGALADPQAGTWFRDGAVDEYLQTNGVTCLVLPVGASGQTEGTIDFAKVLGLTNSPLFELEPLKSFGIDEDRWLLGFMPTVNYQASVVIYRLEYNRDP